MSKYVTLGADEIGQVYGLELGENGKWGRNSLGYPTSCAVIRPLSKENYEYVTEDPESAKELWQSSVGFGKTELGLKEWFNEYVINYQPFDESFVFELLDDEDNPTVHDKGGVFGDFKFRKFVEQAVLSSENVPDIETEDDVYDWECSGWFSPKKPFVIEFAPKALLEEYYAHLRETDKEFKG